MKENMRYYLLLLIIFLKFNPLAAQTYVSGRIYSNTTWTKVNSPYIVTDTIVVFPNVILTIEPGVTVKFDANKELEIRNGCLLALGTKSDSIIFTNNSSVYSGVRLNGGNLTSKFSYCRFKNAQTALAAEANDSTIVLNSVFDYNVTGLKLFGDDYYVAQPSQVAVIKNCFFNHNTLQGMSVFFLASMNIDSSRFSNNAIGLQGNPVTTSSVTNCLFEYNNTGLDAASYMHVSDCRMVHNQTGVQTGGIIHLYNSDIDSNSVLGIKAQGDSVANCNIRYNAIGIKTKASKIRNNIIEYNTGTAIEDLATWYGSGSTIEDNRIMYNNIGIDDKVSYFEITGNTIKNNITGVKINYSNSIVNCNRICSNTSYDLINETSGSVDARNNSWCTMDSASTESKIYDGYDNINRGLVSILPINPACAPADSLVGIQESESDVFNVYPNPTENLLFINLRKSVPGSFVEVYNILGKLVLRKAINNNHMELEVRDFTKGIYLINIYSETHSTPKIKVIIGR